MQTQHLLNKVSNTVQQLHKDTIAAMQLVAQAQAQHKNWKLALPCSMQAHNLQVLADMLQDAFKHIDNAACTASDLYAD
jgi:23S rRNA maturation mini-RNase III